MIGSLRTLCVALAALLALLAAPVGAGPAEQQFLLELQGRWAGEGRAATTQGEAPVACEVESRLRSASRISLSADCHAQGQSGRINLVLSFSNRTQQFHGELTSPLNYASGGVVGRLSRGDLFLRLSASDGSEGGLLLVGQGDQGMRLLVTTIVDGASITIFDLPLTRVG